MVARLTPDQKAAFFAIILITISVEKNVKAVMKCVEIMKQHVQINGKCCCVESFCLSPLYASADLINIDKVKGSGDGRGGEWRFGCKLDLQIPLCINQFQQCPSPPGIRGEFAHVVSLGGGAFAILSRPRELGIIISRGDPRAFDTRVFERQISLSGRTRPLSKTGLSIRD